LEAGTSAVREQRHHHVPGVVPVARVLRTGVAQPGDNPAFGGQPDYSASLVADSPPSAPASATAAGTSTPSAAPSAGSGSSSACGATTCSTRVSGSTWSVVPLG